MLTQPTMASTQYADICSGSKPNVLPTADRIIKVSDTLSLSLNEIMGNRQKLGSIIFNNRTSTQCLLEVHDQHSRHRSFWIHEFLLVSESLLLSNIFRKSTFAIHPATADEIICKDVVPVKMEDADGGEYEVIRLEIPCVETFEPLLRWLYDHNDSNWIETFTKDNFDRVLANVAFMRLNLQAYDVCAQFYEAL
ncbi:hypothetical protein K493DRAFT_56542 [Basidiobolus meristosporus CBS 931.73]|uniref:BTB domain-containing protein n=1 Tax=Basidiobolus meristosporus CBS 931.73 TaxID=1314790 RepID=A0A1Y1XYG2_9FUNG|nr:hypothetical protein K493DRAFT_56542 [Basidiobolus meristosporus CBS 931.73]|eukprot:ORX90779.1 hypothetical protein K493DRAFT_56542 [Basidiobolus meristosporus CBS 931.73]